MSSVLFTDRATTGTATKDLKRRAGAVQIEGSSFTGTWEISLRMGALGWVVVASGSGDDGVQFPGGWDDLQFEITTISAGTLSARVGEFE